MRGNAWNRIAAYSLQRATTYSPKTLKISLKWRFLRNFSVFPRDTTAHLNMHLSGFSKVSLSINTMKSQGKPLFFTGWARRSRCEANIDAPRQLLILQGYIFPYTIRWQYAIFLDVQSLDAQCIKLKHAAGGKEAIQACIYSESIWMSISNAVGCRSCIPTGLSGKVDPPFCFPGTEK
jgi:hypothetical protein